MTYKNKFTIPPKSTVTRALFLFICVMSLSASMPLTETAYVVPQGRVELTARGEFLKTSGDFRRETGALGLGILPKFCIWYSFQYLHKGNFKTSGSELGDSFLRLLFYINDFFNDTLHSAIIMSFRFPTGRNAYSESQFRNLAFGKNELKIGPIFKIDIKEKVYLHLNIFYVFREGAAEDMYNGLYLNPSEKNTYKNLFGLNYKTKGSFLESGRLKNDYIISSSALNTDVLYPFIPYLEFYFSRRIHKRETPEDEVYIEGSRINPILLSCGIRYFFSNSIFIGTYYINSFTNRKRYIKNIIGFDFSLQF